VQRSLLPDLSAIASTAGFAAAARWEPCTYASGDYYDVVPLTDGRHLIVLGDVMGHGADASLTMAICRAQVRELARSFRRVDQLLLELDGYLRDNAPPRRGMSLFAAAFDGGDRVLEYASAGHPFPLLCRDDGVHDLPGRPGVLLGLPVLVGTACPRHELELAPGDRLLTFTDGLMEVPIDDAGTELGRSGLAELLGSLVDLDDEPLLDRLFEEVRTRDIGPAADDDRTALVFTVGGPSRQPRSVGSQARPLPFESRS
jgi:phosphoserine phosphatase RsbU/P